MQFLTDRPRRPAVRLVELQRSSPTAPGSVTTAAPQPAGELASPPVEAGLAAAPSTEPSGELTDAERVVLEDLFHQASRLSAVCLVLLGVALLGLLVVLMA